MKVSLVIMIALALLSDDAAAMSILVNAAPPPAHSHAFAMRRVAEALASAGHSVTLLESLSPGVQTSNAKDNDSRLTVLRAELMSDKVFHARFDAGESFQRLMQEINSQWAPQVMPSLLSSHFDLAVVDAVHPFFARRLALPSVHVQCSSDDDASEAFWFYYGLAAPRSISDLSRRIQFAALVALSWLKVGTHVDELGFQDSSGPSWSEYYRDYVMTFLLQGSKDFVLPPKTKDLARVHPERIRFVGSLTARLGVNKTEESKPRSALVAFGTKAHRCPMEILDALSEIGLSAVVLIDACLGVSIPAPHVVPSSRDQAAWLQGDSMRIAVVHGGMHSLYEAVSAALPIACVPHEGDQWANCRDLQHQNLGWALHPKATKKEAMAVFRMLLKHDTASSKSKYVAAALNTVGGPGAVVQHVLELSPHLSDWHHRNFSLAYNSESPEPFFAAPWRWLEGWLIVLLVVIPALPVLPYVRGMLSG